jgi:hypothetical protein
VYSLGGLDTLPFCHRLESSEGKPRVMERFAKRMNVERKKKKMTNVPKKKKKKKKKTKKKR